MLAEFSVAGDGGPMCGRAWHCFLQVARHSNGLRFSCV